MHSKSGRLPPKAVELTCLQWQVNRFKLGCVVILRVAAHGTAYRILNMLRHFTRICANGTGCVSILGTGVHAMGYVPKTARKPCTRL